jgi:hypothetical protein
MRAPRASSTRLAVHVDGTPFATKLNPSNSPSAARAYPASDETLSMVPV